MNISEILSLAKAGYRKKDIDALINAENSTEQIEKSVDNTTSLGTPTTEESAGIPVSADEPSVDYKSMYEATKKTLEATQTALRDAQKINSAATVNVGGEIKDTNKILEDVARSFM